MRLILGATRWDVLASMVFIASGGWYDLESAEPAEPSGTRAIRLAAKADEPDNPLFLLNTALLKETLAEAGGSAPTAPRSLSQARIFGRGAGTESGGFPSHTASPAPETGTAGTTLPPRIWPSTRMSSPREPGGTGRPSVRRRHLRDAHRSLEAELVRPHDGPAGEPLHLAPRGRLSLRSKR